jgi:hypothetical protein
MIMNPYISPQMSTFPSVLSNLAMNFSNQDKWSNPVSLYQTQRALQTAKIFKCVSECTSCRTQLVAMHNTVMTRNTTGGYAQYRYDEKHNWWLCTIPLWQETQLVAMHNTFMTRNTTGGPPSETYITWIPSTSADRLTVRQFKYWGKGASEDIMTTYTMYCLSKIQGTNIINLLLPTTANIIPIYISPYLDPWSICCY